jgi:hypothetical protein
MKEKMDKNNQKETNANNSTLQCLKLYRISKYYSTVLNNGVTL